MRDVGANGGTWCPDAQGGVRGDLTGDRELDPGRGRRLAGAGGLLALIAVASTVGCADSPEIATVDRIEPPVFDEEGSWAGGGGLPEPLVGSVATVWNDQIYIIGGYADSELGSPTSHVLRVSPETGAMERLSDFPLPIAEAAAVVYRDTLLVIGGNSGNSTAASITGLIRWYDADRDVWERWGTLPDQRFRHSAQTVGDAVYVLGGGSFTSPPDDSIAVVEGHTSRYGPPPNRDFANPVVSGLIGDTILMLGSLFDTSVLRYVPTSDQWLSGLGSPLDGTATGGVVEGRFHTLGWDPQPEHRIWDGAQGRWLLAPPPPVPVERAALVDANDRLFLIGGQDRQRVGVNRIQVYTAPGAGG